MSATCASIITPQVGANVQRLPIYKSGDKCGSQVVIVHVGWKQIASAKPGRLEPVYSVECVSCGARREMSEASLTMIRIRDGVMCRNCTQSSIRAKNGERVEANRKPKICTKCYDLPHCRPRTKPCSCGGHYAGQVIAINLDDRSTGNGSWSVMEAM